MTLPAFMFILIIEHIKCMGEGCSHTKRKNFIVCILLGIIIGVAISSVLLRVSTAATSYEITGDEPLSFLLSYFNKFEQEDKKIGSVSSGCYVYSTLDANTQRVYDEVYYALDNHLDSIEVGTTDLDVLNHAVKAVYADHGNIFWASGYIYTVETRREKTVALYYAPKYTFSQEERTALQAQIDIEVDQILSEIADHPDLYTDDYEKAKYLFSYLAENVDYRIDSENNQNILSVFLNKETVCKGYTCAFQYLLNKVGIKSSIITGDADGQAHTWNLVFLDGAYYYIDVTLGNSVYSDGMDGEKRFVNYTFFCITTDELLMTHSPNSDFVLPICTATADNYFFREGLYFSDWEPDIIGNIFSDAYTGSDELVAVRFSNSELYEMAKTYFVENHHIQDYCDGIESLQYIANYRYDILMFKFH